VYTLAFVLFDLEFSPLVSIILVVILHLFVTGAFHEDGLADSVDALGGGYTVEKRLEIMKDSRIGTYGTVALVMALLLKVALLEDASQLWLALLAAPAISRLTPLLLMASLPYVSGRDTSKSKPVADGFSSGRLLVATAFTLILALTLSFWHPLLFPGTLTAVLLVAQCWGAYLRQQLGGYTGDNLGASVVFGELILLMFV
jgi:adenosylcobinamide-GDP ribazoletransferase